MMKKTEKVKQENSKQKQERITNKRNNTNSFSDYYYSTINPSRSKYSNANRRKWNIKSSK